MDAVDISTAQPPHHREAESDVAATAEISTGAVMEDLNCSFLDTTEEELNMSATTSDTTDTEAEGDDNHVRASKEIQVNTLLEIMVTLLFYITNLDYTFLYIFLHFKPFSN